VISEKLQKVLARAGLGSRRELEGWISAGRVSVDGKLATLGDRVTDEAKIRVDGGYCGNVATSMIDLTTGTPEVIREGHGDVSAFV